MKNKEIVREGYDKVSYAYRDEKGNEDLSDYTAWVAKLVSLLAPRVRVLDLGCGCGVPVSQILSENFTVTGIDLSPIQIARAKTLVPQADFVRADMTEADFPARSFAAIVSFYAIIHVPLEEQQRLFTKLYNWLEAGGY